MIAQVGQAESGTDSKDVTSSPRKSKRGRSARRAAKRDRVARGVEAAGKALTLLSRGLHSPESSSSRYSHKETSNNSFSSFCANEDIISLFKRYYASCLDGISDTKLRDGDFPPTDTS